MGAATQGVVGMRMHSLKTFRIIYRQCPDVSPGSVVIAETAQVLKQIFIILSHRRSGYSTEGWETIKLTTA